jgi:hypothetical protein
VGCYLFLVKPNKEPETFGVPVTAAS